MNTLRIDGKRFSGLPEALYDSYETVNEIYPYDFKREEDWQRRIAWLDTHQVADSKAVGHVLMPLNQRLGGGKRTLENVQALTEDSCLTVVTGQQAGLFTGPLYTLYKAATTIKTAKALSERTGRNVVPVFWMATEDHDYAEVAMNWNFDGTRVRRARLPRRHKHNAPVGALPVTDELVALCEEVSSELGGTLHGQDMTRLLKDTLAASDTLGDWFGRLLLNLFAPWGLVVLDPSAPEMRMAMRPFFRHCLQNTLLIQKDFMICTDRVTTLGFRKELELGPGQTGLFIIEEGHRIALYSNQEGTWFSDRKGEHSWSLGELTERLEQKPEEFSTGAALRPVLQDWLLPVAGVVLGPSETAYHAQLGEIYGRFGRKLPVIVPRESWVLAYETNDLSNGTIEELIKGSPEVWLSDRVMDKSSPTIRSSLEQYRSENQQNMIRLMAAMPMDSQRKALLMTGVSQSQEREMKWILKQLRRALPVDKEGYKMHQAFARMVRPLGKVQERTLLPWYFLSQFGTELVQTLVNSEFSLDLRLITGRKTT